MRTRSAVEVKGCSTYQGRKRLCLLIPTKGASRRRLRRLSRVTRRLAGYKSEGVDAFVGAGRNGRSVS